MRVHRHRVDMLIIENNSHKNNKNNQNIKNNNNNIKND